MEKKKLGSLILISILLLSNIFLFNVFNIYNGNIAEIPISLNIIYQNLLFSFAISLCILLVIGILMPIKIYNYYIIIILFLSILTWLQGNIILWDYGVIGKGDINWSAIRWRGWVDAGIWTAIGIIIVIFRRSILRIAWIISSVLIAIQSVNVAVTGLLSADIWSSKSFSSFQEPSKEIFKFSTGQNIIHIILDELQSTVFDSIIKEKASYAEELDGFIFFPETTGSFPTTQMSLPAILGGEIYQNDEEIDSFLTKTFNSGDTIANILFRKGYEIDIMYSVGYYHKGKFTNGYSIPVPYVANKESFEKINSIMIFRLALVRAAPHFLRVFLDSNKFNMLSAEANDRNSFEAMRQLSHQAFLKDFVDRMYVEKSKPIYKFIHINTPHYPAVLDSGCNYVGGLLPWTWPNIYNQARCSFEQFMSFIRKLKELDIYNRSLIIFHGDHGYYKVPDSLKELPLRNLSKKFASAGTDTERFAQIVCSSLPTLAIKLPNANGPMRISNTQAALTDIRPTILSYLNISIPRMGVSIFSIDPTVIRERTFTYYDEMARPDDKYYTGMTKYKIRGSAVDAMSWDEVGEIHSPSASYSAELLKFGTRESARFLRSGWSAKEVDPAKGSTYIWAIGEKASLLLEIPRDRSSVLQARVKTIKFPKPQSVTLRIDGKEITTWHLSDIAAKWEQPWPWEEVSVTIPADESRPRVSKIDFVFSQSAILPNDSRPLSVLFESLKLSPSETR